MNLLPLPQIAIKLELLFLLKPRANWCMQTEIKYRMQWVSSHHSAVAPHMTLKWVQEMEAENEYIWEWAHLNLQIHLLLDFKLFFFFKIILNIFILYT